MREWLNEFKYRLRFLLKRRQLEKDLEDELAFHIAMREEALKDARHSSPHTTARVRFGNATIVQEECREVWIFGVVERLGSDVRYALRSLRKTPSVTLGVALSLTLGLGATASVFSLIESFMTRPLPVPQTQNIVRVASAIETNRTDGISYLDFKDLRERAHLFDGIAATSDEEVGISLRPGEAAPTVINDVSANFFTVMQTPPLIGRDFGPDDEMDGHNQVAVISYDFWERHFDKSRTVVGRTIFVNGKEVVVVGVASKWTVGLNPMIHPDAFMPFPAGAERMKDRTIRLLGVFARLKSGASLAQAKAEVDAIGNALATEYPESDRGRRLVAYSQLGFNAAEDPDNVGLAGLFMLVVTLVLGVACVNVVNLLLSKGPARSREMAIRLAIGGSRSRLIRQVLIEAVLLSLVAAAMGLGIASLCGHFISQIRIAGIAPVYVNPQVDLRVGLFAIAVALIAGVCSGLSPAMRSSRFDLNGLLKVTATGGPRGRTSWVRSGLALAQVVTASAVLVVSGLSLQILQGLKTMDPGFRIDNIVTLMLSPELSDSNYNQERGQKFYSDLLAHVRAMPSVHAAVLGKLPLFGHSDLTVSLDPALMPKDQTELVITGSPVSDGYFEALGIPIVRGRAFSERDTATSPKVAIINQVMADRYWPDRDPIGARFRQKDTTAGSGGRGWLAASAAVEDVQIIGVSRTAKYNEIDETPLPYIYRPLQQEYVGAISLFVETGAGSDIIVPLLRDEIHRVDPVQAIYEVRDLRDHVRRQALWASTLMVDVVAVVGAVGLVLGVLGLYAVLAHSVSQRTHEIGIRMAVGASRSRILGMILWTGARISIPGTLLGVGAMAALRGPILSFLDVPPAFHDSIVYFSVAVAVLTAATIACCLPAYRASSVAPSVALRSE